MNGKQVHQTFNMNPTTYKGNTLYTSDPYHDAADVIVEDLKIVSPLPANGMKLWFRSGQKVGGK